MSKGLVFVAMALAVIGVALFFLWSDDAGFDELDREGGREADANPLAGATGADGSEAEAVRAGTRGRRPALFGRGHLRVGLGSVIGRLVDQATEAPVADATLRLSGRGYADEAVDRTETSDADGRFHLKDVPAGEDLGLEVRRADVEARVLAGLVLDAGTVLDLGTIWLGESGTLEGRVVNAAGKGVAGADVRVVQGRFSKSQIMEDFVGFLTELDREPVAAGTGESDRTGRFRIGGLPPGPATVIARVPGHHQAIRAIAMTAEGAVGGEIVLRVVEAEPLTGRVVDTAGSGVAGARIAFLDQQDDELGFVGRHFVETEQDGTFLADAPPRGRRLLALVTAEGYPTLFTEVGIERDALEFELKGGATLALRFVFADTSKPIPDAAVVAMVSEDEAFGQAGTFLTGVTDTDGRIELRALPGVVGMVLIQHPAFGTSLYSPQAGIYMGGPAMLIEGPAELVLTTGEHAAELRVPRGIRIRGRVTDVEGKAIAGAVVTTEGSPFGIGKGVETLTDDEGQYGFQTTGPSAIRVVARAAGYVQDPETMGVERGEGMTDVVRDITMLQAARVEGVVVDPQGVPLPGVEVRIRLVPKGPGAEPMVVSEPGGFGASGAAHGISNGQGRFVLEDISPGAEYVLVGRAEGYVLSQSEPFSVAKGGATRRAPRLQLARGAALDIEVLTASGEPARSADVEVRVAREDGLTWSAEDAWSPFAQLVTDGAGKARVTGLPDGTLTIVAETLEDAPSRKRIRITEGRMPTGPILIRLRTAATLRGRVVDQHGDRVAKGHVYIGSYDGPVAPKQEPPAEDDPHWMPHQNARTDDEGRFAFERVPAGAKVEVSFNADGYDPASLRIEDVWAEAELVVNRQDPELHRKRKELQRRMMAIYGKMGQAKDDAEREALQEEMQAIAVEMGRLHEESGEAGAVVEEAEPVPASD